MSSLIQEHLDQIQLLEQQRRRQINEEAELARRSIEISIQRCQAELGITDPLIASAIAREVLEAEEAERQQMASVRVLWREHRRLLLTEGQPIPGRPVDAARRIQDKGRELSHAQVTLDQGQQERRHKLRRYINLCRVEFTRVDGRQRADILAAGLKRERAANPRFNGVGHPVPWGESFIRVGEADDYLTIHNPAYPRGPVARDLASKFRNIKAKGRNIAIRALKHAHGQAYAGMMGDRKELSCSRLEPGLFRPDPAVKRQPVTARIIELASDAGHGRGYALAVQGHGDDGPFYGIASYNHISDVSPNNFFGADNLGDKPCRMVDFNFQLISGKLPMESEVEIGTLLIEIARFSFGARLFRSECSPLNARYIDTMTALGLSRFQAIEPASYNSNLAASTWKFDLCAWKSMEEQLRFQGRWFVLKNTMQEDTEAAKQMHDDPEEPLPDLAIVQVEPTIFEDPAAFEPMERPPQSASQPHVGPVQWPQDSESMEWSSGSYLTGTTPTNDSGTSSGLGYSDSAQSRSNPSTFHDNSHTGSSSGSSVPRPLEASGPFNVGDRQASPSTQEEKTLVWQGAAAMKALRDEEAARAMPPPELPRRLTLPLQQSSSSSSSSTADYPVNASGSMEIYSQASTSYDPKGKRPASSSWIGQPGPSTEAARPAQMPHGYDEEQSVSDSWPTSETWPDSDPWPNADPWLASEPWPNSIDAGMDEASASQAVVPYDRKGKRRAFEPWPNPTDAGMEEASQAVVPYDRKGKRRAFEPWSNPTDAGMEEASQAVVPYDRKGKRPASVSWDTQPKRPSPLHQSLTSEGTVTANMQLSSESVDHQILPQSLNAAPNAASPQTSRLDWSDLNQRSLSLHCATNQSTNTEPAHFSPGLNHSQPTPCSPQSPVTWQENQSSSRNGDSAVPSPSLPQSLSPSYTVEVGTPNMSPSWAPSADQGRPSGASTGPAIHNLLSTPLAEVAQPSTVLTSSGAYNDGYEDGARSQTETLSIASEVFAATPQLPGSETTPLQAWSSHVHREVSPPQVVDTYSSTGGEHVSEMATSIPRSTNSSEPQQQMRSVQASLPVTGFEHSQQRQPSNTRQTRLYAQPNTVSHYTVRQQVPDHYNLALYNYVEFVEEKLSEQVRSSQTQAEPPAEPEKSSSKGQQPRQTGTQGAPVDRQVGRRNTATRGPARGVSKPQQKGSNGARQAALGSYPANGTKSATNTKKAPKSQQKTTRVESYYLGQPGPSSSARPPPSQDKGHGRKKSPASKPTSISRANPTQRTTSLDTLLSNIALTPESHATSIRASRSSASSSTHPTVDGQTSPFRNAHESSNSWGTTPQQAASQQAASQQVTPQRVTPQQVAPQQVAPQQVAPQPATLPQTTCRQEKEMQDKSKQRPWQL